VPQTVIRDVFVRRRLTDEIITEAIMEILNPRRFQIIGPDGRTGTLVAKGGYVVYQPTGITDTEIPMVLRFARGFQLQRRFMDASLPVLAQDVAEEEEEEEEEGDAGGMLAANLAVGEGDEGEGVAAPKKKKAVSQVDRIVSQWMEWVTYVRSGGVAEFPKHLPAVLRFWSWILKRYATVPEAAAVALRWWVDTIPTFAERRMLMELAVGPEMDELRAAFGSNIVITKQIVSYRIYNPMTHQIEFFCRPAGSTAAFSLCDSNMIKIMDKTMGNTPVSMDLSSIGGVLGFLTNKKSVMVFKTLMLDPTKAKTPSMVGAECGNTSNKGEHYPRIAELQRAAAIDPAFAPFVIPGEESTWDSRGLKSSKNKKTPADLRAEANAYEHVYDISHKPMCLYMEFLTRLLDTHRVGGRRWFLDAIAAFQSDLRGRA
jgi:hypothetical protein